MDLSGLRTYFATAGIVIHQIGKAFGFDFDETLISGTIDGILGLLAIYFRWQAAVNERIKVRQALYTPVPNPPRGTEEELKNLEKLDKETGGK